MIFVKRIRRQCGMRGCRNTDTYSLSRFNESAAGNIIICRDCLEEAKKAVENCTMPPVDYRPKKQSAPPPLFHNMVSADTENTEKQTAEGTEGKKDAAAVKKTTARKRTVKSG